MAENKETIILDVQMDVMKVAKELGDATKRLNELKAAQKQLDDQLKNNNITAAEYGKQTAANKAEMEAMQRTIKSSTALLQASEIENVKQNETLDQQRQKLNALQKAYGAMTDEQKNAEVGGKTLTERINELSESVKAQEASIGDNRRNVGAYTDSILKAAGQMGGFGKATTAIINPVKQATLGLKAMGATPIIAILNILVTILVKIAEKFKGNAAAMEGLTKVFGLFNGVGVIVDKLIDKLAQGVGKLADWLLKAADAMGLVSDEMREAQRIAQEELNMNKKQRDNAKQNAEDMQAIAELRAKANEKDRVGTAERLRLLEEANAKEEAIAKRNAELAKQAYELQVAKNAQSESSQEDLNKENDLYIQMLDAQTAYLQKQREIQGQMAELRQKQVQEAQQAAAVRLEIERSLQDALIALDEDAVSRQINQIRVAGEREVENLKIKLSKLKQTDTKARKELADLIVAREKQTQKEIDAVTIQAAEKRAQAMRANAYAEQELLTRDVLQLAKFREQQAQQEYTRIASLTEEQQRVLYGTEEAYNAALLQAEKTWSDERIAVQQEAYARQQQAEQNEYERRLQQISEGDEVALFEAQLARAEEENAQLLAMDEQQKSLLYGSQQAYEAAVIASENRMVEAKKQALNATKKMAQSNYMAVAGALGSLSGILDQFSEQSREAAIASKAIALGKIAIETGVAIASGTAQAQSVPFPANIAAIASTVATVLANIGTAISTVKSAKFANGGVVGGTSYTGDKVPVQVNSAELITNPKQAANLLYEISNNPVRGGIDYEQLGAAVAAANASIPAPVLNYSEFEDFNQKRITYNEIASI